MHIVVIFMITSLNSKSHNFKYSTLENEPAFSQISAGNRNFQWVYKITAVLHSKQYAIKEISHIFFQCSLTESVFNLITELRHQIKCFILLSWKRKFVKILEHIYQSYFSKLGKGMG